MARDLSPNFASQELMWHLRHRFGKNGPECLSFVDAINDLPNIEAFLWGWTETVRLLAVGGPNAPVQRREAGRESPADERDWHFRGKAGARTGQSA